MKDMSTNSSNEVVIRYKIYYKNSKAIGNICTVCLLFDADGNIISRGVAICSLKDIHRKSTGRNIAIGRAIKALKNEESTEPISGSRGDEDFLVRHVKTTAENYKEIAEDLENYSYIDSKIVRMNNINYLRMTIPLGVPIWECMKWFKFKSEYKPTLNEEEIKILGSRKLN